MNPYGWPWYTRVLVYIIIVIFCLYVLYFLFTLGVRFLDALA